MCIIIKSNAITDNIKEMVKNAWDSNPHGAGIAVKHSDNTLVYVKGLMKLETLQQTLNTINNPKITEVVIHLRFTTHGATNQENCHPYIVKGDENALVGEAEELFFHNGIIGRVNMINRMRSDTYNAMIHAKNIGIDLAKALRFYKQTNDMAWDKFVVMYNNKETELIGDFVQVDDNTIASNKTYIKHTYKSYQEMFLNDI